MLIVIGFEAGRCRDSLNTVSSPRLSLTCSVLSLHPVVLAFVRVSAPRLRKRLSTHPTLVRFLTRVGQFVFLETGHLRKALGAALKLAGVRSLTRVRADVVLEVPGSREGLAAVGVGADKGTFPRVHAAVDVEMLGSVEPLATARELALAGTVGDVDLLDVRTEVCGEGERALTAWVVALVRLVLVFSFNPLLLQQLVLGGSRRKRPRISSALGLGLRVDAIHGNASIHVGG